ncbi:MAG: hypothetical protein ACREJ0_19575 [Geminicoccaceae bacterium]
MDEHEHDIFVSYAPSDLLSDWSTRLVEETRRFVATGLRLGEAALAGWCSFALLRNHAPRLVAIETQRRPRLLVAVS